MKILNRVGGMAEDIRARMLFGALGFRHVRVTVEIDGEPPHSFEIEPGVRA